MEMKLRKLWPLLGAACVSLMGSAFADNYQHGSGSSSTQMQQQSTSQAGYQRGTYREITPTAGPRVAHGVDLFITADFIWWKATQEGTQYAFNGFKTDSNVANAFVPASKGKTKNVAHDWAPGFKVGLGLNMGHDGWDIYAQYTWLRPSNSNSISSSDPNNEIIGQYFANPGIFSIFIGGERASANWDLDFNVIDLELGRNFYLSQFLTMRPFIGLKGTWQSQDYKWRFTSADFTLATGVDATGPYRVHQDLDVWGIGVRGGFNIAWYMSKNWSIYGDLAWTALWSDYYELKRRDVLDDSTTNTSVTTVNVDNDTFYSVKYVGELELGLRWETWFYDDNYHFSIQAGWEQQVWINWSHFVEILDEVWNDLNFHGLNLKFRFDF